MRKLQLGGLVMAFLPSALACSGDKQPFGDIGYGASDGTGATGASQANGGTGNSSSTGNKGGKASSGGKGGSGTTNEGGAGDDMPPGDQCTGAWSAPTAKGDCDLDALEDSGVTIGKVESTYRVVSSDTKLEPYKTYKLDGLTIIEAGVTLTIGKCTKIIGQSETSVLITDSGLVDEGGGQYSAKPCGRLVAIGEQDAPIVMTSSRPPGMRKPGDWGGVVLGGKAPENRWRNPDVGEIPHPLISEGIAERAMIFGWRTDEYADEDSGTLKYVRLEYVGHPLNNGDETNGLTLNAVGRGTTLSHVMVANAIDDCFEWFGGTVNADHLIAYNCDDDGFDTDFGFNGNVQFGFIRQYSTSTETDSNGFESDNSKVSNGDEPITRARFSNITACGGNTGNFLTSPRIGAVLRRGSQLRLLNTLITGFDSGGLTIRNVTVNATLPTMTFSTVFDNPGGLYDPGDQTNVNFAPDPDPMKDWFYSQEGNSSDTPAGFCDCYADPPLPFPVSPIAGGVPGADFPEPEADFQGAFKDSSAESNWMTGLWVDWAED